MKQPAAIGRIALRVEGDNWVAYWADTTSLDGAIYLGSIRMAFVNRKEERKKGFMDLMTACAADALEDILGTRPDWNPAQAAPESERRSS